MADNVTEEEPSIEEILDSIRQIISEDDDEDGDTAEEAVAAEETQPDPEPEVPAEVDTVPEQEEEENLDEVIDLVDKVEPDPEPEPEPAEESVVEEDDDSFAIDVPSDAEPAEDETAVEPEIPVSEDHDSFTDSIAAATEDSILTQNAENATLGGFETLVKKTALERSGGITIEDIVRSELKPMLRDWLDAHLPPIIERLVQEELERLSKRALDE